MTAPCVDISDRVQPDGATPRAERVPIVSVFDTTICDNNLGNQIIMEAVLDAVRELFAPAFIVRIPYLEGIGRTCQSHLSRSDHVLFGGTNALSGDMRRARQWGFTLANSLRIQRFTLLGVGWWKYESRVNLYSRLVLQRMLRRDTLHSVRDAYTAKKLRALGFDNVVNTGCPSLWPLTADRCESIPHGKADDVVLTFTEYNQDPLADALLFRVLAAHYRNVYFWPQQPGDFAYARRIAGDHVAMLDPSLAALDAALADPNVEYVGTRLHAGIRAMQRGRRATIIAIDNRATEMGRDFALPIFRREQIAEGLAQHLNSDWPTRVALDAAAIAQWKQQFANRSNPAAVLRRIEPTDRPMRRAA